ncbi:MAG: tetratricopeptide repeat protein, partial [Deinococcota bacterium]|nr:tetratricopeptide repeat protein [Deinococcota bacterium]
LQNLGLTAQWMGERQRANDYYQEALALAKAHQDHVAVAECLLALARLAVDSGDYHHTVQYAKEAAALWRDQDNQHGVTWSLIYLGLATLRTGKPREAQQIMQDALRLARKMDFAFEVAQLTAHLGLTAYLLGDHNQALNFLLEALGSLPEGSGWQWSKSLLLADVGRVEVALGRYDEAQDYFLQSLMIALPYQWLTHMLSALAGLAELNAMQGGHERALELASLVIHHSAGEQHHKDRMKELLSTLQSRLLAKEWSQAVARGKALVLEEVVKEILRHDPLEPQRAGDNA